VGEPLEAEREPVTTGERLDAPPEGGAAVKRALSIAASQFVRHRVDRARPVDEGAATREGDDLDLLHRQIVTLSYNLVACRYRSETR
jgi:hypothetical protein